MTTVPDAGVGRRSATLTGVEVRQAPDGGFEVRGHAAVFDTPAMIGDPAYGFEEVIAPGAFTRTIADKADVRFLFNHNPDLMLARTKSGTLRLYEDTRGLAVEAHLAPTSVGKDLAILLQRGDVSQMSFGFRALQEDTEWVTRAGMKLQRRTVTEAQLFDVSAVVYPAYDETDLAMREVVLARELRDNRHADLERPRPARSRRRDTRALPPADASVVSQVMGWLTAIDSIVDEGQETLATYLGVPSPDPDDTEDMPATAGRAQPADATESRTTQPANATAKPVDERTLSTLDLITRHADGDHANSPRVLCPACKPEPADATPA